MNEGTQTGAGPARSLRLGPRHLHRPDPRRHRDLRSGGATRRPYCTVPFPPSWSRTYVDRAESIRRSNDFGMPLGTPAHGSLASTTCRSPRTDARRVPGVARPAPRSKVQSSRDGRHSRCSARPDGTYASGRRAAVIAGPYTADQLPKIPWLLLLEHDYTKLTTPRGKRIRNDNYACSDSDQLKCGMTCLPMRSMVCMTASWPIL